jgi:hypothetical protein
LQSCWAHMLCNTLTQGLVVEGCLSDGQTSPSLDGVLSSATTQQGSDSTKNTTTQQDSDSTKSTSHAAKMKTAKTLSCNTQKLAVHALRAIQKPLLRFH